MPILGPVLGPVLGPILGSPIAVDGTAFVGTGLTVMLDTDSETISDTDSVYLMESA